MLADPALPDLLHQRLRDGPLPVPHAPTASGWSNSSRVGYLPPTGSGALFHGARSPLFKSSTRLVPRGSCSFQAFSRGALLSARKICNSIFSSSKAANSKKKPDSSSHCSSVQDRLAVYGSEALDTIEHLGLILGSQKKAQTHLEHFGSLDLLSRASVEQLTSFISRSKALRLISSLRLSAVVPREERKSLTIDNLVSIAGLCSEMRFLDRESLRVVLLNAKQQLIKVAVVSQGSVNESIAHPREIFKPVITHSAYSFIMVHNLWAATHKLCYVDIMIM